MTTQKQTLLAIASLLALCATGVAQAQTKIQCLQTQSGRYEAPLAWQNTLGASRANAMCADAVPAHAKVVVATALAQARPTATDPVSKYFTLDGEKTSSVLSKWARLDGYRVVWSAPSQVDLSLNAGQVEATSYIDAVGKLIAGVNSKIAEKRASGSADAQFSLPIEALVYADKVVSVAVKQ